MPVAAHGLDDGEARERQGVVEHESAGALEMPRARGGAAAFEVEERQREVARRMIRLQLEGSVPLRQGRLVPAGGGEVSGDGAVDHDIEGVQLERPPPVGQAFVEASMRTQVPAIPEVPDGGVRIRLDGAPELGLRSVPIPLLGTDGGQRGASLAEPGVQLQRPQRGGLPLGEPAAGRDVAEDQPGTVSQGQTRVSEGEVRSRNRGAEERRTFLG